MLQAKKVRASRAQGQSRSCCGGGSCGSDSFCVDPIERAVSAARRGSSGSSNGATFQGRHFEKLETRQLLSDTAGNPPCPPPCQNVCFEYVCDPCDSSKKALKIKGTCESDCIEVCKGTRSDKVRVKVNGCDAGEFCFSGCIIACGEDGCDKITVKSDVCKNTFIFGGCGDDCLKGGGGWNVICGNDGNDYIEGNCNRDICIGGKGCDEICAGGRDDLIVCGYTCYDNCAEDLWCIQKEWNSDHLIDQRSKYVRSGGGKNGSKCFSDSNCHDDCERDKVTSGDGKDVIYGRKTGDSSKQDCVTDWCSSDKWCEICPA